MTLIAVPIGSQPLVHGSGCEWRSLQRIFTLSIRTELEIGNIVICENSPAHKAAEVQDIIEAQGGMIKISALDTSLTWIRSSKYSLS
jgi:hypothetical protein